MKKAIIAKGAPAPIGPYSHAVRAGDFLFISGQLPLDPETGRLVEGSIEDQTELVFSNMKAILTSEGMDFSNIVKATVFITDLEDFARVNSVYANYFPENPPARSCIPVSALPAGAQVEIEVIAVSC